MRYEDDDYYDTLNSGVAEEDGGDYDEVDNSKSNSGVGVSINNDTPNSGVNDDDDKPASDNDTPNSGVSTDDGSASGEEGVNIPVYGLDSDFGVAPYWNNGTITSDGESYMLSVIATFSNMDGLHGL